MMGRYRILIGNIVADKILANHDLIINPTNPQMVAGSGVAGAIFKKAGVDTLEAYTQSYYDINYFSDNYKIENIMKVGDIRITPGFNLGIDIMFVQGPKYWEYDNPTQVLFDVYNKLKNLYEECISLISEYGFSTENGASRDETELDLTQQYRRNPKYKEALDLVIAKLSAYFEPLDKGGIRSNVFTTRVTLDDIRRAKLVVCSFGMAGKSPAQVDPIQMGLSQLSASNISHIRSIFSKAEGKFNFKVWEEFQRWGSFPDADAAIQTALTGGRKLGDINFIITNDVKQLLKNDRFGIFGNITSFAIGAIGDDDTRYELCRRLSVPLLKQELDRLVTRKGNTESFEKQDSELSSMYDKAFLVQLDKSVSTMVKMLIPDYVAKSDIFRTGVNLEG